MRVSCVSMFVAGNIVKMLRLILLQQLTLCIVIELASSHRRIQESPGEKTNIVHSKCHRTLCLQDIVNRSEMQNNNNILLLPLISQKNLSLFFLEHLLQGLYGVDAPDVIYCLLLLNLT